MNYRILSLDPGTRNFAWAYNYPSLAVGWLPPMDPNDDTAFTNACIELLTTTRPQYVVAERFQVRAQGQSVYAEVINQMLGRLAILTRLYAQTDLIQITAAQWKNWHGKRNEDWHTTYSALPSVHQQDAAAMGQYADTYWIQKLQEKNP